MREAYQFIFVRGGPVMYPIALVSVLSLALFLERLWVLRRDRVIPAGFRERLRALIRERKLSEAEVLCQENGSALANVVRAGLRSGGPPEVAKEAIQDGGRREVVELEKHVDLLGTLATVEPLLGLLGTVTGLIRAFQQVEALAGRGGGVNPSALAGGIWEALITTAAGLIVGIPAYLAYRYLLSRVDHLVVSMEEEAVALTSLIGAVSAKPEAAE